MLCLQGKRRAFAGKAAGRGRELEGQERELRGGQDQPQVRDRLLAGGSVGAAAVKVCSQAGNFAEKFAQHHRGVAELKLARLRSELIAERAQPIEHLIVLERNMQSHRAMVFAQRDIRRER
ncbi:hypothetical protein [Paraburkholderia aromaticivorans]|uniref:hypothetical protein n=1 Tax=Paraburkholderia aromaticivorans TaxID=2026199 RepID=UPI001F104D69|nr:hypothetical protein [Paraburkholderia aromaticivorans]